MNDATANATTDAVHAPTKETAATAGLTKETAAAGLTKDPPTEASSPTFANETDLSEEQKDAAAHTAALWRAFRASLWKNLGYYLALMLCFYLLKQSRPQTSSYVCMAATYVFALAMGHVFHRVAHTVSMTEMYRRHRRRNLPETFACVRACTDRVCQFGDFHATVHHDTSVNKRPVNVASEFVNNVVMQGGGLLLLVKCVEWCVDTRVLVLWMLMYATVHNVNYEWFRPSTHRDHHTHADTNFGIDIADIVFDTKHDLADIESHNHAGINLLLVTCAIVYFSGARREKAQ